MVLYLVIHLNNFKHAACVHFAWLLVCAINYLNGCLNLVLFT